MVFFKKNSSRGRGRLTMVDIIVAILVISGALYLQWPKERGVPHAPIAQDANSIRGHAILSDGDSLKIGEERIRLLNMDAPELHQTCGSKGREYACGEEAKKHLAQLINHRDIICLYQSRDQYQRLLALCHVDGEDDLNRQMVLDGWAVGYNGGYANEQNDAKQNKRGIWRDKFQTPYDWRKDNPRH